MTKDRFLLFLFLAASLPSLQASERLRIAVHEKPPYAERNEQGAWVGIGISLWQSISDRIGLPLDFVEMPYEQIIPSVESGAVDGAVGELAITPESEQRVRFTQPYLISSIGIAVPAANARFDLRELMADLKNPALIQIIFAIFIGMVLVSIVIWLLERRHRAGHFHGGLHGFGSALWFSAVTMTGVGYGDKIPSTVTARLISFFWMLVGILLVAGFTAAVTSSITAARLDSARSSARDLHRITCATLAGSMSEGILAREGVGHVSYESLPEALAALQSGTVQAVVADTLSLRYLAHRSLHHRPPVRYTVVHTTLKDVFIGIPLPRQSPHYDAINVALLQTTSSPEWAETLRRWLGSAASEPL